MSTALLSQQHDVPGWYCQGIVVAYERARGKRVMNQKCDGSFEVSVSKVIAATTSAPVKALGEAKQRRRWTAKADSDLVKALEAGLRHRYKWDGMTVQFNLYPKGPGKTSIVAPRLQRQ